MHNVDTLISVIKDGYEKLGIGGNRPILLMVSGGTDSALLPRIFSMAGITNKLHVFHVNYGLRGKESDGDEEQVVAECNRLGIAHTVHKVTGMSRSNMEKEARDIRYNFVKVNFKDYIKVTAHHIEDQAETVLIRIIRGCSIYGYSGIDGLRKDMVWRPFLNTSKSVITEATKELGIVPRVDSTNYDETITRNWVRHSYMPDVSDSDMDSIIKLSEACKSLRSMVDKISEPVFDKVKISDGTIVVRYKEIDRGLLEDPLVSKRLRDRAWNMAGLKPWNDEQYHAMLSTMYKRKKGKITISSSQEVTWEAGVFTVTTPYNN